MKRFISITIIFVMMLTFLIACTDENQDTNEGWVNMVDPAGNEISVPNEINSIISMAPSIAEVLIELGYGDKIIATDTQSDEISGLPEDIPQMDMMAPDVEQLISLEPDIILASAITMSGGSDPLAQLKELGICLAYIPSSNSIDEIYSDLMFISKVVGEEQKGQDIIDDMKENIERIKTIGDSIGDSIDEKRTVYFELAAAPDLYSFGSGVFLNEMIELVGGVNILGDEKEWLSVSEEAIISANPDVIITNVNYIENPVDEIKSREGWESIAAVSNDRVYYVDNMASSLPNHNIIKALKQMAAAIYPEEYDEYED